MKNNYKESFEQMSIAGSLAAETLDEVTSHVKPGITTEQLDKICLGEIICSTGCIILLAKFCNNTVWATPRVKSTHFLPFQILGLMTLLAGNCPSEYLSNTLQLPNISILLLAGLVISCWLISGD